MTRRGLLLSLLLVALLSGVSFFNDMVLKNTYVIGNYLPIAVFGPLILFVLIVNPLWRALRGRSALGARETAAVMALLLFACYPAGRGFIHYFTTFLMLPHHHARTFPAWQGDPARLTEKSVRDWAALRARLRAAAERPEGDPARVAAARVLPEMLEDAPDTPERRAALLDALNDALADPSFRAQVRRDALPARLPLHVRSALGRNPADLAPDAALGLNRALLEIALGDALVVRRPAVLAAVPPQMLADPSEAHGVALDGFVAGLGEPGQPFSLRRIPWSAWARPLLFWLPLLGAMGLAVVGLGLVLHRQWAEHEHLPYPTVEFAREMLPEEGRALPAIFRRRLFWAGFGIVFAIHMINYANVWWPDYVIPVQRTLNFEPLLELMPTMRLGGAHIIFAPTIFFTAVGFAFFLSSDVALSLGIAPYVFVWVSGVAAGYGVAFGGQHLRPSIGASIFAGANVALFLGILYSGRRHLVSVFAQALGFRRGDPAAPSAVWGARAALAGFALFVLQLAVVGVEWPLALLYTLGALMIFTVMTRLLAEAGVFFFHPHFYPCAMLWGFMGAFAIGPEQLLLLGMVSSLMLIDPREALMPFAMSAFKLADGVGVRLGRVALWGGVAVALSAAVAIPVSLYWQYREGAIKAGDGWTVQSVPRMVYDVNVGVARALEAQGRLDESLRLSGAQRWRRLAPQKEAALAFAVTFALALLFGFLRRRFARWPFHPLLFAMGAMWQSRQLAFSFLLGWAAKGLVMKYGGARGYQRVKPLAVGLIAGEVLAAFAPLLIGAIYHALTGQPPKPFRIMPT